ncbi:MAG: DUF885 domain-containing protein [Acidobacteria bacterium]|nr:DUF885 domain-containing protein [Acidobacteriota bacterium]MCA1638895.1 DUF885 domain-containing protein [Acidobacteriota bacterium]
MKQLKVIIAIFFLFTITTSAFTIARAQTIDEMKDYNDSPSRLRGVIERFSEDYGSLNRFYTAQTSQNRLVRFRKFYAERLAFLNEQNFNKLNKDEQIDYLLFKNHLAHEQRELDRFAGQLDEMSALLSFAKTISDLEDTRRKLENIDSAKTAALLNDLNKQILATQKGIEENKTAKPKKPVANRAARTVNSLRNTLKNWFTFYNGYDPIFTWWNSEPYKAVDASLQNYSAFLLDKLVGIKPDDKITIIGDPIGREALLQELEYEMIPYTPEELVEIANKEFAWCESEMKKASRELGYGNDWKKALEAVKQKYVEPGKQPELIRKQAYEAIEFIEKNALVTVPKLARDSWRMEMMTPERQLVSPFFLGGETILVSYPTSAMTHEQKMMSMRGNNPHFTHAVTHHELIPGHHLQRFMLNRHRPYRAVFNTPFWIEGWALYWEFLLWDMNFNRTPEDRIGALFWRMHRCARIIFSLNFHLEKMSPQEAVDFLVTRVGHERDNATAEVRRSFSGDYGPLYQIAYMIGGLQFYNLHRELVGSKKMTNRAFHDRILKEGAIPVEMVRAILTKQKLPRDLKPSWRFYGGFPK